MVGYKIKAILKDRASRCPRERPLLCCSPGPVACPLRLCRSPCLFSEHCFLDVFSVEEKSETCHMRQESLQC